MIRDVYDFKDKDVVVLREVNEKPEFTYFPCYYRRQNAKFKEYVLAKDNFVDQLPLESAWVPALIQDFAFRVSC